MQNAAQQIELPYLTPALPGVGGILRERPEDFFVQELPLYEPAGEGEHILCEIQKIGMTTIDAIQLIARKLRIHPRDIGYAGLKDADALTRQHLSIAGVAEPQVMAIHEEGLSILWAARHRNKLRLGHLSGNRFAIRIRQVDPAHVVRLRPIVDEIIRLGMPNYFGLQRFGRRGNNDRLAAALLAGDGQRLCDILLGQADAATDSPDVFNARSLYDQKNLQASFHRWPPGNRNELRVLNHLLQGKPLDRIAQAIDPKTQSIWFSSLQSRVFNAVVARRIEQLATLMPGDVAYKHTNGACFRVTQLDADQPRADAFEISPTGPMPGRKMLIPSDAAGELEREVYAAIGIAPESFDSPLTSDLPGERRPLRVRPGETSLSAGVDEHGPYITVVFSLPAGSFATTFVRELTKQPAVEPPPEPVV